MCKEMPVIPVSRVVDPKIICNWKKWRAKEEERHKGSLTHKKIWPFGIFYGRLVYFMAVW
jgi:hypothetical protein